MRGEEPRQPVLFSYVSLEDRVPKSHPLRKLRVLVDGILASMGKEFDAVYSNNGRPSIPPERLLRALLLQVLFSVRSERMLVEQMEYNLLFRWFVGFGIDERVFDATVFTHNRARVLNERFSREFFGKVKALAQWRRLTSDEHFTVDGSLIEAWASVKSFRPKNDDSDSDSDGGGGGSGRNPSSDFHGEKRGNQTHESTTDPESRLYRKGNSVPAKLSYMPHLLTENRNGLIAEVELTWRRARRNVRLRWLCWSAPRSGRAPRWLPTRPMTRRILSPRCARIPGDRTLRRTRRIAAVPSMVGPPVTMDIA